MIRFFKTPSHNIIAVQTSSNLQPENIEKLKWLFSGADCLEGQVIEGWFVGPRKEMITPWSTNAVEITQNMGIGGVMRMEEFFTVEHDKVHYDH